jgi:hypothetical protein
MFFISIELALPSLGEPIIVQIYFEFPSFCGSHEKAISEPEPALVQSVREIAASSASPFQLCEQGTGGTYFVVNAIGERVAVFKPIDEEPGSRNNPKQSTTISPPIMEPGGGAIRETLAFQLDRNNLAGVPETYLLNDLCHPFWIDSEKRQTPKTGSIQKYVPNFSVAADVGSSLFTKDDVHNIGIFDLRYLNLDRNGENLLVVKDGKQHRLVPIDHSYILPPKIQKPYFEWLYWKQAKEPFSPETLKYIAELDVERDAKLIANHGLADECTKIMKVSTTFLKRCAAAGLTLFQIGSLVSSGTEDAEKSVLESLVEEAERLSEVDDAFEFYSGFGNLVDSYLTKKNLRHVL